MSDPFIDPGWFVTALASLLGDAAAEPPAPSLVQDIRVLGAAERADPGAMVRRRPSIAIVPTTTTAAGPDGVGNGRILTEQVDLMIQVDQVAGADANAIATLRTIREAIFALLEGTRLAAAWSPLRYQGGRLLGIDNATYTWADRYATQQGVPIR